MIESHNKKAFISALDEIIAERELTPGAFYVDDIDRELAAAEYFRYVSLEIERIADKIFSDDSFYEEQFGHYISYRDYINDIINDEVAENKIYNL